MSDELSRPPSTPSETATGSGDDDMPRFERRAFGEFGTRELFDLARLRIDVFVVQQACPYPELDDLDVHPGPRHALGFAGEALIACARTMPPAAPGEAARIGRVAVREGHRGTGVARRLMSWTIEALARDHPDSAIVLGAQVTVERFYAALGFARASDEYVEDGILHVEMLRPPDGARQRVPPIIARRPGYPVTR